MLYIAHRALLDGKKDGENHPDQISYCLDRGYDVEIDLRYVDGQFWLGHDEPQYKIDQNFLHTPGLWIHCKDIESAMQLKKFLWLNFFTIDKDDFTLTSRNWLWLSPTYGKAYKDSICVMPEDPRWNFTQDQLLDFAGLCTDNVYHYVNYVTDLRRRRGTY